MTLRGKLLLVALSILVLPWAGWQFVRQMEFLLRQGQEQALLASAEALARSVAVRPGRLPPAVPGWFVHRLDFAPRLDGEINDWQGAQADPYTFGSGRPWLRLSAARASERLHLLIQVDDTSHQRGEAHWPADLEFDRLRLRISGPSGDLTLRLANSASGELRVAGEDGLPPPIRIEGFWREHEQGYTVELALPQAVVVRALAIEARDLDADGRRRTAGSLGACGRCMPTSVRSSPNCWRWRRRACASPSPIARPGSSPAPAGCRPTTPKKTCCPGAAASTAACCSATCRRSTTTRPMRAG
jgi:two-component system sensor histidine kinase ChvG